MRSVTRWAAGLSLAGLLLACAACGGSGDGVALPSARPSGGASVELPSASRANPPAGTEPPAATKPPAVTEPPAATEPPARPSRSEVTVPSAAPPATGGVVPVPPSPTRASAAAPPPAAAPSPTLSAVGTATASDSTGMGSLGWLLLIALAAALIGGLVIWRARRKSSWDTDAAAVEADTRTVVDVRLPSVLTAQTGGQRALSWPPVRADLIGLRQRWDVLAERASDERRSDRALHLGGLLDDLVTAVDAENEALATGRDFTLLRPPVDDARRAISGALAGQPLSGPPPGNPGPATHPT